MLTLIDLGAEFWRNYFGSKSAVVAYELTLEHVDWYRRDCPRTVVCCDSPKSLRKEWFEGYKSNRSPKPQDAIDALVAVQRRIATWGVPVVLRDGYEGDDVLATLTAQAWIEEVQIIGSEKDLFPLIAPNVRLMGRTGPIGANECMEKFGVAPAQMTDWIALVGDAADAIPGCPHCGPGRASDLLERFGTIPGIQGASDEEILGISGIGKKTLESLRAWDPALALRLVRLIEDVPVSLLDLFGEGEFPVFADDDSQPTPTVQPDAPPGVAHANQTQGTAA
jgi:5'-3' exonuclease